MSLRHVSLVKEGTKTLSFQYRNRPFLIGFQNHDHAIKVAKTVQKDPHIIIEHIDRTYDEYDYYHFRNGRIVLDLGAALIVPKKSEVSESMKITQIPFEDFMSVPEYNRIGVSIPYHILEETPDHIVFLTRLVDLDP